VLLAISSGSRGPIGNVLCQIIGPRKCLAAVRTNVWSFLGMRAQVSSRRDQSAAAEIKQRNTKQHQNSPNDQTYRFKCSNLLNKRPHVGIGQECDLCGYGPSSIIVALRARRTGPARSRRVAGVVRTE